MGIKIDYLYVLKILNNFPREQWLALDMLYHKIEYLNNNLFEKWSKPSFYSVIQTLKSENYIITELMKKTPPALVIKITKKAQDMLKFFEN